MNTYIWLLGTVTLLTGVITLFFASYRMDPRRQERELEANARSRRSSSGAPRYRI